MKPSQKVNETRVSLHGTKTHFGRVSKADDKTARPSEMVVNFYLPKRCHTSHDSNLQCQLYYRLSPRRDAANLV